MQFPVPSLEAAPHPISLFHHWFSKAAEAAPQGGEANAMVLATVDMPARQPKSRVVLLKSFGEDGFCFYTNYKSPKAQELEQCPKAAMLFYWTAPCKRQVRIEGKTKRLSPQASDAYFATRERHSQIAAHASEQSSMISSRKDLEERFAILEKQFADKPIPRPPHWGGCLLVPEYMEFWQNRPHRLHDRLAYRASKKGGWECSYLSP